MNNYGANLATLTNDALREGIAPEEIVLNLDMISHELKNGMLARAAERINQTKTAPLIHPTFIHPKAP